MMTEELIAAQREAVVSTMRSFLGTPYHHQAERPGVGLDCITSLREAFIRGQVVQRMPLGHYSPDWHLHRDVERYIEGLLQYFDEMPGPAERTPQPGDIALFQVGRTFSHGAMVEEWPKLLHCQVNIGCVRTDYELDFSLRVIGERVPARGQERPMKIFALKEWVATDGLL